ncbi:uncharacterized protein LOC144143062 [Haemaphysalis longicornis]
MDARSQRYTLFGFSQELDWRPLHFVEPIPPGRICSVCGLVPKVTGSLPCGHVVCKSCYQQCALGGSHACPLDGDACPEEDVYWRCFPADNLTRRKVKCWNDVHGCSMVTTAAEIVKHFHHNCQHHPIACPKCSVTVPRLGICLHLKSCRGPTANSAQLYDYSTTQRLEDLEKASRHMYAALHNAIKQTNSSIASMQAELLTIQEGANRSIETATRHRDRGGDIASLKASLEGRANDMRSQLESLSHSQSSRLRELAESIAVTTNGRDTELNHMKERIGRCLKAVLEIRKDCTDRATGITGFEARLNKQMDALRESLKLLFTQNHSQARRLQELSRSVRVIKEAVKERTAKLDLNGLACNANDVTGKQSTIPGEGEGTSNDIVSVLRHIVKTIRTHQWLLKGFTALKEEATQTGKACYTSDPVYLRGYCISPGVSFMKHGRFLWMYFSLELYEGEMDESLQWPFDGEIQQEVIHPDKPGVREVYIDSARSATAEENDDMVAVHFDTSSFFLGYLEHEGYIKNDQLILRLELLL